MPNRLAVAVEAAESLVDALAREPANRAAVVAFAGRGVLRCPLTENLGAVLDALHRLRPGAVRPGGTDLGAALDAALEAVDHRGARPGTGRRRLLRRRRPRRSVELSTGPAPPARRRGPCGRHRRPRPRSSGPSGKDGPAAPVSWRAGPRRDAPIRRWKPSLAGPDGVIVRLGLAVGRSRHPVPDQDRAGGSPAPRGVPACRPGRAVPAVVDSPRWCSCWPAAGRPCAAGAGPGPGPGLGVWRPSVAKRRAVPPC